MELEFDKEIDALLRRTNRTSPGAVTAPAAGHLDADELAAFAENALPENSRQLYVAHLADCDDCRRTLSTFVSTAPEQAAAAAAPTPITPITMSWYQRIFRVPNLAYTMGALVVLFSGIIGLLVYQNKTADLKTQVSQVRESAPSVSAPAPVEDVREQSANSSANVMTNSTVSPIESVTRSGVAVGSSNAAPPPATQPNDSKNIVIDGVSTNEPSPTKPDTPAPAVAAAAKPAEERELVAKEKVARNEDKDAVENNSGNRMELQNNNMRDMSPDTRSAKRTEGPRQVQSQINQRQIAELPRAKTFSSLRTAGGKKFELRDGIWYDTAYTGQSKKDYKRGTEKYIRLDAGLRAIADEIGGTVVVVWNGQAYKIK
jgi:hypothetical protein